MKFSILIPTYNNLKYLKLFCKSVEKNSFFKHQIILHVNDGTDGTLEYAKIIIIYAHKKQHWTMFIYKTSFQVN